MASLNRLYVKARERFVNFHRAQTMTEYALVLAAIAVAAYAAYTYLGNNVSSLASGVGSTLNGA